jgi:hypothetical protein
VEAARDIQGKMKHATCLIAVAVSAVAAFGQSETKRLGAIDFFGYKGLDVKSIRAALPLREGDPFPGPRSLKEWKNAVEQSVSQVIDRAPTDAGMVCCDDQQNWMIYIGLPGESSKPVAYNSAPHGDSRLPPHVVKLYREIMDALRAAVMKGKAGEDDSQGYSLSEDPAARAKQLALHEYALQEETTILRVVESSADARHRTMAVAALGSARQSDRQIAALVKASLDTDNDVRDNAVRALWVLARAKPDIASRIPVGPFIGLLASGSWTDHNKAVLLLEALTETRRADLLLQLRSKALDPLEEMARWRSRGHAYSARMIVGRIAGIEENRLSELAQSDQVDAIVKAVHATE